MAQNINQAECPYCGLFHQFNKASNITVGTAAGNVDTFAFQCLNMKGECDRVHIVVNDAGRITRYPPAQPHKIPGAPPLVMGAYAEAVVVLEAGAPRAAATMIRRTVASAASNQGVPEEDEKGRWIPLLDRIDQLKDKLLPATHEAAKAAKLLGDAGAHEEAEERLGAVDEDTVRGTIAVVRIFLSNLYELPAQVKAIGIDKEEATEA